MITNNKEEYYTLDDFEKVPKFDAHLHYHHESDEFTKIATENNFRLITINTEAPTFPDLHEQERLAGIQEEKYPQQFHHLTTISMLGWENPGWAQDQIKNIKVAMQNGAIGVKIWKNIGMSVQDDSGKFIMIDDRLFDPLFDYLEKEKIPVLGHLGEPKNCWLPLEKMTINSDREYFSKHPEYHMYLHNEYPSYEEQIAARDKRLDKNPRLVFIGAHMASLEWSVDELAKWLDKYPNCAVDLAERVCHLELQSVSNREKVRNFMIKYSERIIYGTDIIFDNSMTSTFFKAHVNTIYQNDWRFFTSDEMMSVPRVNGEFQGLKLPVTAIDKIYFTNAKVYYEIPLSS